MAKTRRLLAFPQPVRLHTSTDDVEAAQQRWIQNHAEQLYALVRLYDCSGLELVHLRETSKQPILSEE
jgi:hypothetical protein